MRIYRETLRRWRPRTPSPIRKARAMGTRALPPVEQLAEGDDVSTIPGENAVASTSPEASRRTALKTWLPAGAALVSQVTLWALAAGIPVAIGVPSAASGGLPAYTSTVDPGVPAQASMPTATEPTTA